MMAGAAGLEPATSSVTGKHSNQLNYTPIELSRALPVLLFDATVAAVPLLWLTTYNHFGLKTKGGQFPVRLI